MGGRTTTVMNKEATIHKIIRLALEEDIRSGDVTTQATVPSSLNASGEIISKEPGVIAGIEIAKRTFSLLDDRIVLKPRIKDGDKVNKNQVIAQIFGPAQAILTGERTALNFMQRMSGIATLTHAFVKKIAHTKAKILDTRKTAPGLRAIDKLAVKLGGGTNHRFGLDDLVMIKDNHIVAAGGIRQAIEKVREQKLPIVVEVKNISELKEILGMDPPVKPGDDKSRGDDNASGDDEFRILLDNFSIEDIEKAVALTQKRIPLEVSGNISLETVTKIAETGVDFISVGGLTHSPKALDMSFNLNI